MLINPRVLSFKEFKKNPESDVTEEQYNKVVYGYCELFCDGVFYGQLDEMFLDGKYEPFPKINNYGPDWINSYGVCDSAEQFMELIGNLLKEDTRKFYVTLMPIYKENHQGWRWHKHGPYIGTQEREGYEYLEDEPNIDLVYCYHINELLEA